MLTQEELDPIFETLKRIMEKYSPPFSLKKPSEALKKKMSFELTSYERVVIAGRPRDEVYFAGLIKQKGYVGFYYMLAYANPEISSQLSPEFMSLLKGKSCFYIKSTEKPILEQVKKALDLALRAYQKNGWG